MAPFQLYWNSIGSEPYNIDLMKFSTEGSYADVATTD